MSARIVFLIGLLFAGFGVSDLAVEAKAEALEQPLLTFDVVEIPRTGSADLVAGDVEILMKERGWIQLTKGAKLVDGARLRIGVGAALTVRFSATEQIEFRPADKERWIVLAEDSRRLSG